jgi:zinc and cadmium transporter
MSSFAWILSATLMGGVLSVLMAGAFAYAAHPRWVPRLVSFAVGTLLGAGFLEVLPHALEEGPAESVAVAVLAGLLAFFVLEKLVLWRHCHHESCEVHGLETTDGHAHDHDHGHNHGHAHGHQEHEHGHQRAGLMILVGDTFHNFVDGVLIAGAFVADTQLGIVTAMAIIAHELPQEVGDFLVLLHSGYSKSKALLYNLLSSVAMVFGGLLGYVALEGMQELTPYLLGVAASSMIYVAVADLIPGLHKRPELSATLEQVLLIGLGIAAIVLIGHFGHAS